MKYYNRIKKTIGSGNTKIFKVALIKSYTYLRCMLITYLIASRKIRLEKEYVNILLWEEVFSNSFQKMLPQLKPDFLLGWDFTWNPRYFR